jgi:threonylcarbamoyladenosine tRNA methylthiotransferase MtaB
MRRRHLRADAMAVVERARALRPGIALGADLIAGFPTETDALFEETLEFVREASLPYLHVFPYSERPGTPAARMPAVPKQVRKDRAAALRAAGATEAIHFFTAQIGHTVSLLTEAADSGHTEHFAPVRLGAPYAPGRVLAVRITGATSDLLLAEAA